MPVRDGWGADPARTEREDPAAVSSGTMGVASLTQPGGVGLASSGGAVHDELMDGSLGG